MLQVALLGEQVISDANGAVRLRSSRTLALVAFLVVHAGSPQSRQRIAAQFWPDSTDEQALTNSVASCTTCAACWATTPRCS
jgi:DNA-binding SARP family transcriptional activator